MGMRKRPNRPTPLPGRATPRRASFSFTGFAPAGWNPPPYPSGRRSPGRPAGTTPPLARSWRPAAASRGTPRVNEPVRSEKQAAVPQEQRRRRQSGRVVAIHREGKLGRKGGSEPRDLPRDGGGRIEERHRVGAGDRRRHRGRNRGLVLARGRAARTSPTLAAGAELGRSLGQPGMGREHRPTRPDPRSGEGPEPILRDERQQQDDGQGRAHGRGTGKGRAGQRGSSGPESGACRVAPGPGGPFTSSRRTPRRTSSHTWRCPS